MGKCGKLCLGPFHNSKGVVKTDFGGKIFKISFAACSAYPQKDNGNEE